MKSVIIFIISLFITQFSLASDFKVVAKVNDKIITKYDLDNYTNMLNTYFKTSQNMNYNNLQNEVLNQLIDDTLKQEAIEKEKIVLDKDEFNYFLKTFEEKNNIKDYKYNKELYLNTVKTNFLLVNSNLIPANTGITFLLDIAFDTLFKASIKISFFIVNFIIYSFFLIYIYNYRVEKVENSKISYSIT